MIAYPDSYAVGMRYTCLQILYEKLNAEDGIFCERAFLPLQDLEQKMRADKIPLFSIDSHLPAKEFDFVCFLLERELAYTNVLAMLDLAQIPLESSERGDGYPIILGLGSCARNPEPMVDLIDIFIEDECVIGEIARKLCDLEGMKRLEILKELRASIPGIYVPAIYDFTRLVEPIHCDKLEYPLNPVVPYCEVRSYISGDDRFSRHSPAELEGVERTVGIVEKNLQNTGLDTFLIPRSCLELNEFVVRLNARFKHKHIALGLPNIKTSNALKELSDLLKGTNVEFETTLLASPTLNEILHWPITNTIDDYLEAVRHVFKNGFDHIRLGFMIGLPFETQEDTRAIVDVAGECSRIGNEVLGKLSRINVRISSFIPRPHTQFQFAVFRDFDYLNSAVEYIKKCLKAKGISVEIYNPRLSFIEAALSRAGRDCSKVLMSTYKNGYRYSELEDLFDFAKWEGAFSDCGFDPDAVVRKPTTLQTKFPWDHIAVVDKTRIWKEYESIRNRAILEGRHGD